MTTELTRRPHTAPDATQQQAQQAVVQMLSASVQAFGDIVRALLCDLERVSDGLSDIGWLGPTPMMLDNEQAYRVAQEQLRWWSSFLTPLTNPQLLSSEREAHHRKARAERAHVRLLARQTARDAHRDAVHAALAEPGLDPERRTALINIAVDPDNTEWWVNPDEYVASALATLPEIQPLIPIVPADLDPQTNFSGARAVSQLREHTVLAPRAQQLDQHLTAVLQKTLNITTKQAAQHAHILTGMFWLALRRALAKGQYDLEASILLLSPSQEAPIREQFTRELLVSWFSYLQSIPAGKPPNNLLQRLKKMIGIRPSQAPELQHTPPKLIQNIDEK